MRPGNCNLSKCGCPPVRIHVSFVSRRFSVGKKGRGRRPDGNRPGLKAYRAEKGETGNNSYLHKTAIIRTVLCRSAGAIAARRRVRKGTKTERTKDRSLKDGIGGGVPEPSRNRKYKVTRAGYRNSNYIVSGINVRGRRWTSNTLN